MSNIPLVIDEVTGRKKVFNPILDQLNISLGSVEVISSDYTLSQSDNRKTILADSSLHNIYIDMVYGISFKNFIVDIVKVSLNNKVYIRGQAGELVQGFNRIALLDEESAKLYYDGSRSIVYNIEDLLKPTVELRTLTTSEISNKYLVLSNPPYEPSKIILEYGGIDQTYSSAFEVTTDDDGKRLNWSGLDLDGFIEEGQTFNILYNYINT